MLVLKIFGIVCLSIVFDVFIYYVTVPYIKKKIVAYRRHKKLMKIVKDKTITVEQAIKLLKK